MNPQEATVTGTATGGQQRQHKSSLLTPGATHTTTHVQSDVDFNLKRYQFFVPQAAMYLIWRQQLGGHAQESNASGRLGELLPQSLLLFAAVLIADVSGFTKLAATLSAEALKGHINDYFGNMLAVVHHYGGDVVKFCGDAVIIVWPLETHADVHKKMTAVLLASMCALDLIETCNNYPISVDLGSASASKTLSLHCGLSCGAINCMIVGAAQRFEFLVAGDAMQDVGLALTLAGTGDVVLSHAAFALARSYLEGCPIAESYSLHQADAGAPLKGGPISQFFRLTGQPAIALNLAAALLEANADARAERSSSLSSADGNGSQKLSIIALSSPHMGRSFLTRSESGRFSPLKGLHSIANTSGNNLNDLDRGSYDVHPSLAPIADCGNDVPQAVRNSTRLVNKRSILTTTGSFRGDQMLSLENGSSAPSLLPKEQVPSEVSEDGGIISKAYQTALRLSSAMMTLPQRAPISTTAASGYVKVSNKQLLVDILQADELAAENANLVRSFLEVPILEATTNQKTTVLRALQSFVHEVALSAMHRGSMLMLSEMRVCTTVFLEIVGLENDLLAGRISRVQRVMAVLLSGLKRFSGTLRQFLVDDKGCVAILVFGLPVSAATMVSANEVNNAARAIQASSFIVKILRAIHCDVYCGIAQGLVYCGLVGALHRGEYAVMGTSINLAARLMNHAKSSCSSSGILEESGGHIAVDKVVFNEANRLFNFKIGPSVSFKGFPELPVYYAIEQNIQSLLIQQMYFTGESKYNTIVSLQKNAAGSAGNHVNTRSKVLSAFLSSAMAATTKQEDASASAITCATVISNRVLTRSTSAKVLDNKRKFSTGNALLALPTVPLVDRGNRASFCLQQLVLQLQTVRSEFANLKIPHFFLIVGVAESPQTHLFSSTGSGAGLTTFLDFIRKGISAAGLPAESKISSLKQSDAMKLKLIALPVSIDLAVQPSLLKMVTSGAAITGVNRAESRRGSKAGPVCDPLCQHLGNIEFSGIVRILQKVYWMVAPATTESDRADTGESQTKAERSLLKKFGLSRMISGTKFDSVDAAKPTKMQSLKNLFKSQQSTSMLVNLPGTSVGPERNNAITSEFNACSTESDPAAGVSLVANEIHAFEDIREITTGAIMHQISFSKWLQSVCTGWTLHRVFGDIPELGPTCHVPLEHLLYCLNPIFLLYFGTINGFAPMDHYQNMIKQWISSLGTIHRHLFICRLFSTILFALMSIQHKPATAANSPTKALVLLVDNLHNCDAPSLWVLFKTIELQSASTAIQPMGILVAAARQHMIKGLMADAETSLAENLICANPEVSEVVIDSLGHMLGDRLRKDVTGVIRIGPFSLPEISDALERTCPSLATLNDTICKVHGDNWYHTDDGSSACPKTETHTETGSGSDSGSGEGEKHDLRNETSKNDGVAVVCNWISNYILEKCDMPRSVCQTIQMFKLGIDDYLMRISNLNNCSDTVCDSNAFMKKFDQLDIFDQTILKIAAVVGMSFNASTILHICLHLGIFNSRPGIISYIANCTEVVLSLQCIVDAKLILMVTDTETESFQERFDSLQYQFGNESIQKGVYALMLIAQRERIHAIVALYFETKSRPGIRSREHEIARHYIASDIMPKKLQFLRSDADLAIGEQRFGDALKYLSMILACMTGLSTWELLAMYTHPCQPCEFGDSGMSCVHCVQSDALDLIMRSNPKTNSMTDELLMQRDVIETLADISVVSMKMGDTENRAPTTTFVAGEQMLAVCLKLVGAKVAFATQEDLPSALGGSRQTDLSNTGGFPVDNRSWLSRYHCPLGFVRRYHTPKIYDVIKNDQQQEARYCIDLPSIINPFTNLQSSRLMLLECVEQLVLIYHRKGNYHFVEHCILTTLSRYFTISFPTNQNAFTTSAISNRCLGLLTACATGRFLSNNSRHLSSKDIVALSTCTSCDAAEDFSEHEIYLLNRLLGLLSTAMQRIGNISVDNIVQQLEEHSKVARKLRRADAANRLEEEKLLASFPVIPLDYIYDTLSENLNL